MVSCMQGSADRLAGATLPGSLALVSGNPAFPGVPWLPAACFASLRRPAGPRRVGGCSWVTIAGPRSLGLGIGRALRLGGLLGLVLIRRGLRVVRACKRREGGRCNDAAAKHEADDLRSHGMISVRAVSPGQVMPVPGSCNPAGTGADANRVASPRALQGADKARLRRDRGMRRTRVEVIGSVPLGRNDADRNAELRAGRC